MRVHVVGVTLGLLLTALLQSLDGVSVRRYEKRREYTPTRMVQLAPYLVADSVESYRAATIDGDSVEAIFDPPELDQGLTFRQSIPPNLSALLKSWVVGFCPLNSIERSISDLIDAREPNRVERPAAVVTAEDAMAMLRPGTSSSTPREVGCWRARAFGECCRGRKLSRRAVDGSSLQSSPRISYAGTGRPKPLSSISPTGAASTTSSISANARWLISVCPIAACVLRRAARFTTGPTAP